jgi:hypothetical protein
MRDINRIDPFIDAVIPQHIKDVIVKIWGLGEVVQDTINSIIDLKEVIREQWKSVPDFRFSQVLIQMGFPNFPGFWFYMEDDEILEKIDSLDADNVT